MARLKILMLCWEYPPVYTGGLGVVCQGITEALAKKGHRVTVFLPFQAKRINQDGRFSNLRFISAMAEEEPPFLSGSFSPAYSYDLLKRKVGFKKNLLAGISSAAGDYFRRVKHYQLALMNRLAGEGFDVIHANDWQTFPAAWAYSEKTGASFVAHVHATEFDRAGGNSGNAVVHGYEQAGLQKAAWVITVSKLTKTKIIKEYQIDPRKITVVHNALARRPFSADKGFTVSPRGFFSKDKKIVLFAGRLTLQKGVDWFLRAAALVAEKDENIYFVVAGDGEERSRLIELAAGLGIIGRVFFTGFASKNELRQLYRAADVLVMPSLSEPFGITPLEALRERTPVIISKNAGVIEVLDHALKVDFWDTRRMAQLILSVLHYPELKKELAEEGKKQASAMCWEEKIEALANIYQDLKAAAVVS